MRLTTTILMLICAVVLVMGIVAIERYIPSTKESELQRLNPLSFNPEDVDGIELDIEEVRAVLSKRDGIWLVNEPFDDRADPDLISKLLSDLREIEWIETISKDEMKGESWKKTGLETARVRVRLKSQGAILNETWLGNPAAMEGAFYISTALPGRGTVHHLARSPVTALLKNPIETWRDSKLLRFPSNQVTRLVLSDGTGQVEVSRSLQSPAWMLVKPLQTRGHEEHIEELLSTLLNLKVDAASGSNSKPGSASASPGSGDSLEVSIDLIGAAEPLKAVLRKPADGRTSAEATVSNRKSTFTVSSEALQSLWAQPNDLRDNRLARLKPETVEEIKIESSTHPDVQLRKQQDSWFLQRHGQLEPANGERVAVLFQALTTHRIREFASDSASNLDAYGLNQPVLSIIWTTADKQSQRISFGHDAKEGVFAKYDSEPYVYKVAAAVLAAFPADSVKWKGLNPLRYSLFALRRISLAMGTAPPVVLDYNPDTSQWSGTLAGKDITGMIDRVKTDRLAGGLAKIQVQDWVQDRTAAIAALAAPGITVTIDLGVPGTPSAPLKQRTLRFAPTQPGTETAIYYGQLDGGPDVFYITRESLRELLAPVFKKGA